MKFEGRVWRHIPSGAHPLHVEYILQASGRWNRPSEYGCLYTALTSDGARAEHAKYLRRSGVRRSRPRELVSLDVRVEPVLDLTSERVRADLGVSLEELTGDSEADLERCRSVADWARSEGYRGILAPSAAADGERVLAIYLEGPPPRLCLREGPDRVPLR